MRRYQFRLATVLRVRQLEEEASRTRLLEAGRAVSRARTLEDEAREHYEAIPTRLGLVNAEEFHRDRQVHNLAAAAVRARVSDVGAAVAEVDRQRESWTQAAAKVTVLQRLDERRRGEHRLAMDREEGTVLDELATRPRGDARG